MKPAHAKLTVKAAPAPKAAEVWKLRLYVAGQTPKSLMALSNLKRVCEECLKGRYTIEVIDLLEHPRLAKDDQILAIPTLVRRLPSPMRKIIGDLSDTERVLVGMDCSFRTAARRRKPRKAIEPTNAAPHAERAAAEPNQPPYVLRLYVTGLTPRSSRAIANITALCEAHLRGHSDLEVIDLCQQPERIPRDQIVVVAPMLVKVLPLPVRRIFGDLEDNRATLEALDVRPSQ